MFGGVDDYFTILADTTVLQFSEWSKGAVWEKYMVGECKDRRHEEKWERREQVME